LGLDEGGSNERCSEIVVVMSDVLLNGMQLSGIQLSVILLNVVVLIVFLFHVTQQSVALQVSFC
jgi:hypothetical protein